MTHHDASSMKTLHKDVMPASDPDYLIQLKEYCTDPSLSQDMRKLLIALEARANQYLNDTNHPLSDENKALLEQVIVDVNHYCYKGDPTALIASCSQLLDKNHIAHFKRPTNRAPSWKHIIGGIALAILGASLMAAAITATIMTSGFAAPISVGAVFIGLSALKAAAVWIGIISVITLPTGIGFFVRGGTRCEPTLAETVAKLQHHVKASLN